LEGVADPLQAFSPTKLSFEKPYSFRHIKIEPAIKLERLCDASALLTTGY